MGKYKNLILNTALFAVNAVATKLISFFLVPLYTSYMSAGEYGLTDMSLTVISLITPLVTLDVSEAAVRYIVGDREKRDCYTAVSFLVTTASVFAVVLALPLLDLGAFGGLGSFKGWFVIAYTSSAFMNLFGAIARADNKVKLIPVCAATSSIVTLVSAIVLIGHLRFGVVGYFISVSMGPLFATFIYLFAGGLAGMIARGTRELVAGGQSGLREILAPMFRYALPLIPNSLFWWAGTSINRLFITGMMGIAASGMFAAAGKVPNLLNTAYSIFQQAWQLSVFQEAGKKGELETFYSVVFRLVSAGLTTMCSILSVLSPLLAAALLRGETFKAWPMISLLLIANLMNVFNSFYGTIYTSTLHTSYVMRTTILGALSCVLFTPLLIPAAGTYGACLASVIGQGLVFVMRARDSRKYVAFDAGLKTLIPTLIVLCVQSAVTSFQAPFWQIISLVCCMLVVVLQGWRLIPIFRQLKLRRVSDDAYR